MDRHKETTIDTNRYLDRIGYDGPRTACKTVLRNLQRHHLLHVPFENLDIHYGRPIVLDIDRTFDKVVNERRGGFCYELNGLFHALLCELGFDARRVSARVFDQGKRGPEFDHMAIVVRADELEWLADVGFGEFAMHPLRLDTDGPQDDPRGTFAIKTTGRLQRLVEKRAEGRGATPQYSFSLLSRELADFEPMCRYHQTSERSHFTRGKLISRPTPDGRITLTGDTLKIKSGAETVETPVRDAEEFESMLQRYFGITLAADRRGVTRGVS
jgi:N-hydroxyarylamine O-acetyltransferase